MIEYLHRECYFSCKSEAHFAFKALSIFRNSRQHVVSCYHVFMKLSLEYALHKSRNIKIFMGETGELNKKSYFASFG